MANKNNNPPPGDRMRARFVLCEVEGSSQEIQNAAHAFAQVMKASQQTVVYLPAPPAQNEPAQLRGMTPPAEASGYAAAPLNGAAEPEPVPSQTEAAAPPNRPQNNGKRKYKTPKYISELEFNGGDKPLKAYIDEVQPKNHSKRYLAITYWLRQYRGIEEVGADHIYTSYRFLNMNVPGDTLSVFRDLKKQAWVEGGSATGLFKITHTGENQLTGAKAGE